MKIIHMASKTLPQREREGGREGEREEERERERERETFIGNQ